MRILAEFVADLEDRVLRALGRLHAARPRHSAIPRAHLAAELPDLGSDALIVGIVDRLRAQGKVDRRGPHRGGQGLRTEAQPGRTAAQERAPGVDSQGGHEPARGLRPGRGCRAPGRGRPRASGPASRRAEAGRDLPQRSTSISTSRPSSAARSIERLSDGSAMTMADLRDLLGTTRKYAVPIGEYLDRIGLTRREGDVRKLG